MATYYVDGSSGNDTTGTGATGAPWKTLTKAYNSSTTDDTIKVRTAVYRESLNLAKSGQTWEADSGHTPRLDGNYGPNLIKFEYTGSEIPGDDGQNMVNIRADGITWDGIDIKHVGGRAIGVSSAGTNATIQNCDLHYMRGAALVLDGNNCTVDNVNCTWTSLKGWASDAEGAGPAKVQTSIIIKGNDITIQNSSTKYSLAEGISADKGSRRAIVRNCVIEDTAHAALYINSAVDPTFDRNFIVQRGTDERWVGSNKGVPGGGILLRDEDESGAAGWQSGQTITNNIVVGAYECFYVTSTGTTNRAYLRDAYIAFNTFLNPGRGFSSPTDSRISPRVVRIDELANHQHANSIFENNIIAVTNSSDPLGKSGLISSGLQFRNNIWYHHKGTLPPAAFRDASDSYTSPKLASPSASLAGSVSANNYKLTSASTNAIDSASNGSRYNNLTPPTVSEDYFGSSRPSGTSRDIGAHEFGGTASSLSASFTVSTDNGTAPLSVTFTDTSTTAAGTVDAWSWNFGDGSPPSTSQNPVHTFAEPGIYTVRLEATNTAGLSDIATDVITVSAPNSGGNESASVDVSVHTLNTSTGTQDLTLSTNGYAPRGALFFVTSATADDTTAADAMLSVGAWSQGDPYLQWCSTVIQDDNTATSEQGRYLTDGYVIATLDTDGTDASITGLASVDSVSANKITLNITDAFPAGYRLVVMAWYGPGVKCRARRAVGGAAGTAAVVDFNFNADAIFTFGSFAPYGALDAAGEWTMGLADSPANQYAVYWGQDAGASDSYNRASFKSGIVGQSRYNLDGNTTNPVRWTVTGWDNNGVSIERSGDIGRPLLVFGFSMGDGLAKVQAIDSPTNTSETSYSFGGVIMPASLLMLLTGQTVEGNTNGAAGGTFGVYMSDGVTKYSTSFANEDGQATFDTFSRVSDSIYLLDDDGTTEVDGAVDLTSNGINITLSTAPASPLKWVALAIEDGAAVTTPTAQFTADVTSIDAGDTVTFTDLSSGNGETITAWEWDFGDDSSSTSQSPTHVYSTAGEYTVSLTVTTVNGTDTETKAGYITVDGGSGVLVDEIVGPFDPTSVSNYSTNSLVVDPEADGASTHGHRLDLDTLWLDVSPDLPLPLIPGKVVIGFDDSEDLRLQHPDGRQATISVTWTTPSIPAASFTKSPSQPEVGDTVTFTNTSTGATSYLWGFGDGATSTATSPTHVYNVAGLYTVTLAATNSAGTNLASDFLRVVEADTGGGSSGSVSIASSSFAYADDATNTENTSENPINLTGGGRWAAFRFTNVTIPQGSTISAATLKVTCKTTNRDDPDLSIFANDVDNAAAFTGSWQDISARTLTTAFTDWDETAIGAGEVTSPSIVSVIQEIVDRGSWASGNAIVLLLDSNPAVDFSIDTTYSAVLDVTYTG